MGEILVGIQLDLPLFTCEVYIIPKLFQISLHFGNCSATLHGICEILAVDVVTGGFSGFLIQPDRTTGCLMGILNNRQATSLANAIRYIPQSFLFRFGIVVFLPVAEADGVEEKMIVKVILVEVGRYNDLIILAPQGLCGFAAYGMTLFSGDFSRLEILVSVPRNDPVLLAEGVRSDNP